MNGSQPSQTLYRSGTPHSSSEAIPMQKQDPCQSSAGPAPAETVTEAGTGARACPLWHRLVLSSPIESFDSASESLYRDYNSTVRHSDVRCLILASILCSSQLLVREIILLKRTAVISSCAVLLVLQLLAFLFLKLLSAGGIRRRQLKLLRPLQLILPVFGWLLLCSSAVVASVSSGHRSVLSGLEWFTITVLVIFVMLPLRFQYIGTLALVTVAVYLQVAVVMTNETLHFSYRLASGVVVLIGAGLLGAIASLLHDLRQRAAYQESRKVMEVKAVIEQQSQTRERLLLSVLPRHVAELMRKDWGQMDVGQFKKVYMNRHENVSILFADIVGFTAISSTYSASDLVKVLNELFASFDRLAEEYHQLRIKILGDCYYCISGCPVEREDHAILSVQMGLSMVSAIKTVRESTKSTVDMRVGIHTGAVLAGVMGQKQWQFDVYSKDVELANKMESAGMPGRVHISNKTLAHLSDFFQVEPALAEKREANLRRAGLTTYFIVKPTKQITSLTGATSNAHGNSGAAIQNNINGEQLQVAPSLGDAQTNPAVETVGGRNQSNSSESEFVKIEEKIILSRKQFSDLLPHIQPLTLSFKDPDMENDYTTNRESTFGFGSIFLPLAVTFNVASVALVTPSTVYTLTCAAVGLMLLISLSFLMMPQRCLQFCHCGCQCVSSLSAMIRSSSQRTTIWFVVMNMIAISCNFLSMMSCPLTEPILAETDLNFTDSSSSSSCLLFNTTSELISTPHTHCLHVGHFVYLCILLLCTLPLQVELGHLVKVPLTIFAVIVHCWAVKGHLVGIIDCTSTTLTKDVSDVVSESTELCISLAITGLLMLFFNFHTEVTARVEFLSKREMSQQKVAATDLQLKNESLVQNLLPTHVTQHFLHRDVSMQRHEELYAQSFEDVGVLFASMPNFSDFYTEESVNNQGLECLRFLNEVISDYDALLDKPKYRGISKIKTIASTYMAASGLDDQNQTEPRWHHLSVLVEFALDLRNTLNNINTESFNHFVLQMGINHGPVTAGVIGARKPHYDIWGNTVNVASRMETTGQAGHIQCTAETKEILEVFGYDFEQRGIINIKGKGQLLTYFLVGRKKSSSQLSPVVDSTASDQ